MVFGGKEREKEKTEPVARPASDRREKTVVAEGTNFSGILKVQGSVQVNGEFEGTIACTGSVLIGKTGKVKAEIETHDAIVSGRIEGRIFAQDRVELQTGSTFLGDVHAKSFMIQDGVFFQGNCTMGDAKKGAVAGRELADAQKPELGILKQS